MEHREFPTLEPYYQTVKTMKESGCTYDHISTTLVGMGLLRGASVATLKQFCKKHNLVKTDWGTVADHDLHVAITEAIDGVGPIYGRKMMAGYLSTKSIHVAESRVGNALRLAHPEYQEARRHGARNLNPAPYYAEYVGHKVHLDQNEKMVMFGVTHVMAIDGYSGKIVGHSTMPIKNNLTIYDQVYRKAVISHGMWDQVRVDCGKEFYLTLFMQEKLGGYRYNQDRPAFLQTPSTRNHRIERMWPEVNNRVNYPLKTGLMGLVNQETINMEDDTVKYIVSTLACQVASLGLGVFVDYWNAHNVPGRGIPNVLATNGCMARITEDLLPSASTAADLYDGEHGAKLKRESHFGRSPLQGQDELTQAEQRFHEAVPDLFKLYSSTVNGNQRPMQDAVLQLIHIMNTAE